jgi:hypothetical protein
LKRTWPTTVNISPSMNQNPILPSFSSNVSIEPTGEFSASSSRFSSRYIALNHTVFSVASNVHEPPTILADA